MIEDSVQALSRTVELVLATPMAAFGQQALIHWIAPERVSPAALAELEQRVGPALFTSAHWLWGEPLRILALTGLRLADGGPKADFGAQQEAMLRLGGQLQAA